MNKDESCQRLLELINGLIDGDLEREDLLEAESMIQNDPECRAVYHTLKKNHRPLPGSQKRDGIQSCS